MTVIKRLYSRAEAAQALAMSERRLDEKIRAGELTAVRDGRLVKLAADELDRYARSLPSLEPSR